MVKIAVVVDGGDLTGRPIPAGGGQASREIIVGLTGSIRRRALRPPSKESLLKASRRWGIPNSLRLPDV